MNQQDAMVPLMFDCFTNIPDFSSYVALPADIELATDGAVSLSAKARYYARKVRKMDFSKPDCINENIFNRYLWYSIKGATRYPAEFAGAHGRGLARLGLVLTPSAGDDD